MAMTDAEIIESFKQAGALLNGHFQLRSKKHSDYFFRQPSSSATPCWANASALRWQNGSKKPGSKRKRLSLLRSAV